MNSYRYFKAVTCYWKFIQFDTWFYSIFTFIYKISSNLL